MFEPSLANKQTVHNTGRVVFSSSFKGSLNHLLRDDARVGSGDLVLGEFNRYDLFDMVFQAEGDFGDFTSRVGCSGEVIGMTRKYCSISEELHPGHCRGAFGILHLHISSRGWRESRSAPKRRDHLTMT